MKKITCIFLSFMLSVSLLTGCTPKEKTEKYTDAIWGTFDTIISVVSFQPSEEDFKEMMTYATERFKELNNLYDIYNDYPNLNNVKTINDNAGIAPVKVEKDLFELIQFSVDWYYKTEGKVNIAMGSLLKVWHDVRTEGEKNGAGYVLPDLETLQEAHRYSNIENIVLDAENSTVYITDANTRLDVGAIAKGYATELVCTELAETYDNFAISAGGNVKVHGSPKDGRTRWGIGIQNPEVDENFEMVGGNVDLAYVFGEASLVCSGGYQRFFVVDDKRYHHLIDPDTLYPADYYQGVTILCKDSGVADVLSTAVFMLQPEQSLALINGLEDAECILILADGTELKTDGFDKVLKSQGIDAYTPVN